MTQKPPISFRQFRTSDAVRVQELFIAVNRDLAPENLRAVFERYIEISIRDEIGQIETYYARAPGFWLAFQRSEMIGCFGLEPLGESAVELRRMYVKPGHRRQGHARLMLKFAEDLARKHAFTKMVLSTSELQKGAIALYQWSNYTLVREELAAESSRRTIGNGIRRYHFEKQL